jgi:hypothetical protein
MWSNNKGQGIGAMKTNKNRKNSFIFLQSNLPFLQDILIIFLQLEDKS